ncbi:MAG TPA: dihydroneopterin aldolase [Chloroflexota bacterium]|nr:dihydroneopterin aldolase [Chloroflexota bacterium]
MAAPRDEIRVTGMTFFAYHGVKPEEKRLGQRFVVDVVVGTDLRGAGESDDVTKTLDYGRIYAVTREIMEGESMDLIEAVAEQVCAAVLALSPLAKEVATTVHKPAAPIPGMLDEASVRLVRRRD